jgi:prepilin-type N-terminal cleavage/methylation domain-containing protein
MKFTRDKWQVTSDKNHRTCGLKNLVTRHPSPVTQSAFTLIEIMVAIAIFMLVVAAVYSTWIVVLKSSQVGMKAAAQIQRQRIAVRTIEDSLTCIQSFQASMQYYSFVVQNGDQPELSFTARLPDNFPRSGRFVQPGTGRDFPVRRLDFTVEAPPAYLGYDNSEKDLVLRQNPILMDMDPTEQSTPLVLARNVKDFTVECWDTNQQEWATEWDDTNSIPPAIRVTLTLDGPDAPALPITRFIAVPSATMPAIVQTPAPVGGGAGSNPRPGLMPSVPTRM